MDGPFSSWNSRSHNNWIFQSLSPAVRQQINEIKDPDEQRQRLIESEMISSMFCEMDIVHNSHWPTTCWASHVLCASRPERESTGTFCDKHVPPTIDMAQYTWLALQIQPSVMSRGLPFWSLMGVSMTAKLDTSKVFQKRATARTRVIHPHQPEKRAQPWPQQHHEAHETTPCDDNYTTGTRITDNGPFSQCMRALTMNMEWTDGRALTYPSVFQLAWWSQTSRSTPSSSYLSVGHFCFTTVLQFVTIIRTANLLSMTNGILPNMIIADTTAKKQQRKKKEESDTTDYRSPPRRSPILRAKRRRKKSPTPRTKGFWRRRSPKQRTCVLELWK